jgi:hypothetical protein
VSQIVPVQAVPNQTLNVTLDGQQAQIGLRTLGANLYFTLNGVVATRVCRDRQRLLLDAKYRGFRGDFIFLDTQGLNDPKWPGLGDRYRLVYLNAGE